MYRFATLILLSLSLLSCSPYQSDGRKALEADKNNLVSGTSVALNLFYECLVGPEVPFFMKEPLEVIDTAYERQNYFLLYDKNSAREFPIAYVYTPIIPSSQSDEGTEPKTAYCKMSYQDKQISNTRLVQSAALAIKLLSSSL